MNEITTAITEIKRKVSMEEWQQRVLECQKSGMSVKGWCQQKGISVSSCYFHQRKIRERIEEENPIVLLEESKAVLSERIGIQCGDIQITLSEAACPEQLCAVLQALKAC